MNRGIRRLQAGLLAAGALMVLPVQALVTGVSGQSSRTGAGITQSVQTTVTWTVQAAPAGRKVRSTSLILGLPSGPTGCRPLQTVDRPLERQTDSRGQANMSETVTLPAAVMVRARRSGFSRIVLCRTFDDSDLHPRQGRVFIDLSSGSIDSATLGVSHIRLRLSNGETTAVVERGEPLQARAWIRYQGQGVLRGVWEVAGPVSGERSPPYRIVQRIHRRVGAGGRLLLQSPNLPVDGRGLWQVRFRLIQPAVVSSALILRYYVKGRVASSATVPAIVAMQPAQGAQIAATTVFRWRPVEGAAVYRLMLRPMQGRQAVGMAMPAGEGMRCMALPPARCGEKDRGVKLMLSPFVRQRMQAGERYRWWVEAIDASGRLIGRSSFREAIYQP